jgi:hypothetical protein
MTMEGGDGGQAALAAATKDVLLLVVQYNGQLGSENFFHRG